MNSFRIVLPTPALQPYIKHFWILKTYNPDGIAERTIPTGYLQMIFHLGERLYSENERSAHPRFFISGLSSTYSDLSAKGTVSMVVAAFQPYAAGTIFQIPVNELFNRNVSTDEFGDPNLRLLQDMIFDMHDPFTAIRHIEQFCLRQLRRRQDFHFSRMVKTIGAIAKNPDIKLEELSSIACLSTKQFQRIFTGRIGCHPKEYTKIVRFQHALHTLQTRPEIHFAALAVESGFYDQAHMIKEFKKYSGYTPGEYVKACDPYSDFFTP